MATFFTVNGIPQQLDQLPFFTVKNFCHGTPEVPDLFGIRLFETAHYEHHRLDGETESQYEILSAESCDSFGQVVLTTRQGISLP